MMPVPCPCPTTVEPLASAPFPDYGYCIDGNRGYVSLQSHPASKCGGIKVPTWYSLAAVPLFCHSSTVLSSANEYAKQVATDHSIPPICHHHPLVAYIILNGETLLSEKIREGGNSEI